MAERKRINKQLQEFEARGFQIEDIEEYKALIESIEQDKKKASRCIELLMSPEGMKNVKNSEKCL